jgi:hypothetical protein
MIKTFFWPKLQRSAFYQKYRFQQDGATPRILRTMFKHGPRSKFSDRFLQKTQWPPRSPDFKLK